MNFSDVSGYCRVKSGIDLGAVSMLIRMSQKGNGYLESPEIKVSKGNLM